MADKKISQLTAATTPLAGTEVLPIVQSGSTVKVSIANVTAGRSIATGAITATVADNGGVSIVQSIAGETGFLNFVDSDAGLAGRVKYDHSNNSLQLFGNALERVRIDSSGNVKNNSGNFILGTAAKGVSFPENTTAAGMTSTLLNWYEEGTWTPALSASGATFAYDAQLGRYTRTGNVVVVQGRIALNSASGGSGAVTLTGLPFTSAATLSGYAVGQQGIIGRAASFAGDYPSALEVNSSSTTANIYYRAASNSGSVQLDFSDVGSSADFLFTIVYQAA
jgi:lipopolysaccharide export system protein LptA